MIPLFIPLLFLNTLILVSFSDSYFTVIRINILIIDWERVCFIEILIGFIDRIAVSIE